MTRDLKAVEVANDAVSASATVVHAHMLVGDKLRQQRVHVDGGQREDAEMQLVRLPGEHPVVVGNVSQGDTKKLRPGRQRHEVFIEKLIGVNGSNA